MAAVTSCSDFCHCCESSRAYNRFPNVGIWQRDWGSPGNLTLKASGIWLQNVHRTGETASWRAQTKPCVHQDPGERSSGPTRDWARLACESPVGGQGHWIQQFWCKPFWRRSPLPPLPLPQFGLRPNYREGTQPHPSTAVNTGVHICLWDRGFTFLSIYTPVELLVHIIILCLIFWGFAILFSPLVARPFCISINNVQRFWFVHIFANTYLLLLSFFFFLNNRSHSSGCEVVFLCAFKAEMTLYWIYVAVCIVLCIQDYSPVELVN